MRGQIPRPRVTTRRGVYPWRRCRGLFEHRHPACRDEVQRPQEGRSSLRRVSGLPRSRLRRAGPTVGSPSAPGSSPREEAPRRAAPSRGERQPLEGKKLMGGSGSPRRLSAVEQRTFTEIKARKVSEDRRPPRGGGPFEPTPGGQGWSRGRANAVEGETSGEFNPRSVTA
jgi:hypothetical protein